MRNRRLLPRNGSQGLASAMTASVLVGVLLASSAGEVWAGSRGERGEAQGGGVRRAYHDQTGKLTFLGADPGQPIRVGKAMVAGMQARERAMAILEEYGQEFGLQHPREELRLMQDSPEGERISTARYQQLYKGVPVLGGELVVNATPAGELLSISGEVSPGPEINVEPRLTADEAKRLALEVIGQVHGLGADALQATEPSLWIYDERLLRPSAWPAMLTWRLEVTHQGTPPVRELVMVDARHGGIVLHFNQLDLSWSGQRADWSGGTYKPPADPGSEPVSQEGFTNSGFFDMPRACYLKGLPWDLDTGDFNADGKRDVLVSTIGAGVQLFLQSPAGHLEVGPEYALPGGADLAVGDLNSDGLDDVAVTLTGGRQLGVTLQSPEGGFLPMVTYPASRAPRAPIVGDVNNDGRQDVVISHDYAPQIGVYLQQSDGTLGPMIPYDAPQEAGSWSPLAIGDVNGDGLLDVVKFLPGQTSEPSFAVFLQTPQGRLAPYQAYFASPTTEIQGGTVGDVTSDGLDDVVLFRGEYQPDAQLVVFAQSSEGHLEQGAVYRTFDYPAFASITDANLDGRMDVVVGSSVEDYFAVHLVSPDGSLGPYELYLGLPMHNENAIVDDVTGDALPDVIQGMWGEVSVLSVAAHRSIVPPPTPTPGPTPGPDGNRQTYTAENNLALPGVLLCDQTQPDCTGGTDPHADAAHRHAGQAYAFYRSHHGRNSIDDAGMTLVSTVHFYTDFANAFWDGAQMVYGDGAGFPLADDVVAHEMTHGVTQRTSGLFYVYQSGAINESFSDVWGEFMDLTNGTGDDSAEARWLLGEDVVGFGAHRDMEDPTVFGHPDRMTSQYYYVGDRDNGGVHSNSGVNNKAVYLMTAGGSFNGQAVNGLGIDKVADIYYEVQTKLLTSGSDYRDLYQAVYQACLNLIGNPAGITAADCAEVRKATDAVEMNLEPNAGFNPEAEVCPSGTAARMTFFDDFEGESSQWIFGALEGTNSWAVDWGYASSGSNMLWGDDIFGYNDAYASMNVDVPLPASSHPFLHFKHAVWLSPSGDGGWVEYSNDGGASWSTIAGMLDAGRGYDGTLFDRQSGAEQPAFFGVSHGYVSTRYDLTPLAGQTIRLRWRLSTDQANSILGWFVDDVRIYTCAAQTFADVPFEHWAYPYIETLYAAGYTAGCGTDPLRYCPDVAMTRAEAAVFVVRGVHGVEGLPPDPETQTFADVPLDFWGAKWIEQLWVDGYTAGCGTDPLIFCPHAGNTRAEGTVFFERMMKGKGYVPEAAEGLFADVPVDRWAAKWVEAAVKDGLIEPCEVGSLESNFCPDAPLTRAMAAYMMVKAKGLTVP